MNDERLDLIANIPVLEGSEKMTYGKKNGLNWKKKGGVLCPQRCLVNRTKALHRNLLIDFRIHFFDDMP